MELIHAHLALAPAPPSCVDPTIPEAVSGVVLKLLAKNAEERYQSAEGLLADLERCREALRGTGTIEPFVAGQRDRQDLFRIHQKLYGREQDIEALTAAFERALEGQPRDRPRLRLLGHRQVLARARDPAAARAAEGLFHERQIRPVQPRRALQRGDPGVRRPRAADPHRERGAHPPLAERDPRGARAERAGRLRRHPVALAR